jgi:hypothetical protein
MRDYTKEGTYLRIALALQNISVHQVIAEQICETLIAIQSKHGEFNINDACDIQVKYEEKLKQNESK